MIPRCLAFLGRNGASFLASGLFIGRALPPVAQAIKPLFSVLIFLMTTAIMLTIDWPRVRAHARHPGRVALVVLWTLIVSPMLVAFAVQALGRLATADGAAGGGAADGARRRPGTPGDGDGDVPGAAHPPAPAAGPDRP